MRPTGIGETLHQYLAKLIIKAARDQAKTACGTLQLCTCLEASMEGATHSVGQRRLERSRGGRREEEVKSSDVEEETHRVTAFMGNLSKDTAGTEEEATEALKTVLGMEIEDVGEINGEGDDKSEGNQRGMGAL